MNLPRWTPQQYLQQHAALKFIVALYINMTLRAFLFWNYEQVPIYGDTSIVGDLLGTAVILPPLS